MVKAIFQALSIVPIGHMHFADYRPAIKLLDSCNNFIACVEILYLMYAPDKLDSCNFCNEGMRFFSRTAPIILPNSFDVKNAGSIARKGLCVF